MTRYSPIRWFARVRGAESVRGEQSACSRFLVLILAFAVTRATRSEEPFLDAVASVEVTPGVRYGTAPTENGPMDLLLDLYMPTQGPPVDARPAFIFVHGGGFVFGNRSEGTAWARHFASRGYVAVSISYRLEGDRPVEMPFFDTSELEAELIRLSTANIIWPPGHFTNGMNGAENLASLLSAAAAGSRDTATAVAWIRSNASELGVDPDHLIVGGISAGAIASLFSSYLIAKEDETARVAGVLDICGSLYGNETAIGGEDPALMIAHGNADIVVPYSFAVDLHDRAESVGLAHEFVTVPGGGHCPGIDQVVSGQAIRSTVTEFFYRELRLSELTAGATFRRGDCNDDGTVDVSDAVFTLGTLFLDEGDPGCHDACDSNDDGAVDISDAINTLGTLFLGSGTIPPPGMMECGVDPTDDELACGEYKVCS